MAMRWPGSARYQSADLATALASFTTTRLAIVARLAKLSPDERRRTGLMAGTTDITVEGLVEIMTAHDSSTWTSSTTWSARSADRAPQS